MTESTTKENVLTTLSRGSEYLANDFYKQFFNDSLSNLRSCIDKMIEHPVYFKRQDVMNMIQSLVATDLGVYLKEALKLHKHFIGLSLVADQVSYISLLLNLALKTKEKKYLEEVEILATRIGELYLPDEVVLKLYSTRAKIHQKEKYYIALITKLNTHCNRFLEKETFQEVYLNSFIELYRATGNFKYLENAYRFLQTAQIKYTDNKDILKSLVFLFIQIWRKNPTRNLSFQIHTLFEKLLFHSKDPMEGYSWARFLYEAGKMYSSLNLIKHGIRILENQHPIFLDLTGFKHLLFQLKLEFCILSEDDILLSKLIYEIHEQNSDNTNFIELLSRSYIERGSILESELDFRQALKVLNKIEIDTENTFYSRALAYQKLAQVNQNAFFLTIALSMAKEGLKFNKHSENLLQVLGDIFYLIYETGDDFTKDQSYKYLKQSILSYQNALRVLRHKNRVGPKDLILKLSSAMKEFGEVKSELLWIDRALGMLLKEEHRHFFDFSFLNQVAECYLVKGIYEKNLLYFRLALFYFEDILEEALHEDLVLSKLGFTCLNIAFYEDDGDEKNAFYHQAEKHLVQGAQMGSITAVYHLACMYSLLGYIDLSVSYLKRLINSDIVSISDFEEDPWLTRVLQSDEYIEMLDSIEHESDQDHKQELEDDTNAIF